MIGFTVYQLCKSVAIMQGGYLHTCCKCSFTVSSSRKATYTHAASVHPLSHHAGRLPTHMLQVFIHCLIMQEGYLHTCCKCSSTVSSCREATYTHAASVHPLSHHAERLPTHMLQVFTHCLIMQEGYQQNITLMCPCVVNSSIVLPNPVRPPSCDFLVLA